MQQIFHRVETNFLSDWRSYIKGSSDSQKYTDMEVANHWFTFLKEHTDFDQLILETANGKDYWIHVSCRKNRKKNRHQVVFLNK